MLLSIRVDGVGRAFRPACEPLQKAMNSRAESMRKAFGRRGLGHLYRGARPAGWRWDSPLDSPPHRSAGRCALPTVVTAAATPTDGRPQHRRTPRESPPGTRPLAQRQESGALKQAADAARANTRRHGDHPRVNHGRPAPQSKAAPPPTASSIETRQGYRGGWTT